MTFTVQIIPPLDPNLYTGIARLTSNGPARTGNVTLDSRYGANGLPEFASWLYVGTAGNVTYVKWDGTTQLLTNLAAGRWHQIYSQQVNTAGTSASGLVWGS
jgi:hypothetical protein